MRLSIVIPVYNEAATILKTLERVKAAPTLGMQREIVIVDDGSHDGTADVLRKMPPADDVRVVLKEQNAGKGAALRTGFENATGDVFLVQDADLEYDPADYPHLLAPILDGRADVVFGSRFAGGGPHRVLFAWHSLGNRFLTLLSNAVTDLNLTDMETGYKVFRAEVIRSLTLESNRFGFEPEVTAKVAQGGWRVCEVPISYHGRTYAEGKKIGWKDGVNALKVIAKYGLFERARNRRG